ncbi:CRISPR-associated protein Cas4 [Ktedonobacter racemifer]|uniref:CRISPR-associated exonuclease Cas4 n=1 Tax=Ktedonobacter racemifer DSM 44963 TaxID=485913 RepID=D6TCJ7_KTERA|nr:CRISPR-associated protein Cas4 [Ktedonobacter racemifer]EFH90014.1 CRISPR-associated protein Cas4 [Ktedonobacter racemifer DSM 44963]
MERRPQPETIPISYLNAFEYCPRRFYYEFVLGDMIVNEFVLEGTLLHQNVDVPGKHTHDDDEVQVTRLHLYSEILRLSGFADITEEEGNNLIPVEYKHGKEGKWLNDHVQLCAQALCLEERYARPVPHGYIFYYGSRKRVQVLFTEALRRKTLNTIQFALQIAVAQTSPPPLQGKAATRCRDCSLRPLCLPEEVAFLQREGR